LTQAISRAQAHRTGYHDFIDLQVQLAAGRHARADEFVPSGTPVTCDFRNWFPSTRTGWLLVYNQAFSGAFHQNMDAYYANSAQGWRCRWLSVQQYPIPKGELNLVESCLNMQRNVLQERQLVLPGAELSNALDTNYVWAYDWDDPLIESKIGHPIQLYAITYNSGKKGETQAGSFVYISRPLFFFWFVACLRSTLSPFACLCLLRRLAPASTTWSASSATSSSTPLTRSSGHQQSGGSF
jgi:hypothetical protein